MKRFLTALLLVVANFFVMPPVEAEIQTYTGTDEYIVGEHETHEAAKNNSKIRAMRNAQDQAGVFIRSRSRTKDLELVDDEVVTLTEGILKVVGAPNHEIRLLGDGKGILIYTTITVEIDTDDLDRRLSEIARLHGVNKPPIDRPKPLETPEPENISPPPPQPTEVDNIALSQQKTDEADKLWSAGKCKDSLPLYNEAIKLNPNNAHAFNRRGDSLNKIGEHEKALEDFKKAIQLEPNNPWHYDCLGWTYNCLGEHRKAISACNKAIQLNSKYSYAYNTLGEAYKGLKNYKQAIENYTKSIQLNPNDPYYPWAYVGRAYTYQALGQHDKALEDFKKAIQLKPNDSRHYDELGWMYNCLGEYYKAISILDKAIHLDTNNAYAYEKLGRAYWGLKQYNQAISYCDKSIQLNPNDRNYPWAYVTRAECYEALGEHDKARADFAKARQLGWKG